MPVMLTEEEAAEFQRMRQWFRNFSGAGVSNSSTGASINPPAAGGPRRQPERDWFYARLTGSHCRVPTTPGLPDVITETADNAWSSGRSVWYDWQKVYPGKQAMIPVVPSITGTANAKCTNEPTPLMLIAYGAVVRMYPMGTDDSGASLFSFEFNFPPDPTIVPPHDHRGNYPESGGWAWSCYAPASLPQMPWAI